MQSKASVPAGNPVFTKPAMYPRAEAGEHKANLDLLRAIAVLLVLIEHIFLALRCVRIGPLHLEWLGVAGVFMFFVHTSLVLMWSLERRPHAGDFYIRRFFRIYPLAIFAILFAISFHIPTMHNIRGDTYFEAPDFKTLWVNLLLVQNLVDVNLILHPLWSLPLEVQMYLYLPFLYLITKTRNALFNISAICVLIMAFNTLFIDPDFPVFVVFVPCFLAGVLAYILFKRVTPRIPTVFLPALVVALALGLTLAHAKRYGWWLSLVLGLSLPFIRPLKMPAIARSSHIIAKYSYGIYLIHPFCITLGINVLHNFPMWMRISAVCLSLAATAPLAYHLVEKPMIDFGARVADRLFARTKEAVAVR